MFRDKLRTLFGLNWKNSKGYKIAENIVNLPAINKKKSDILIPQIMLLTILNHPHIYPYVADEFHRLELGDVDLEKIYHAVNDVLENNMGEGEDPIDHSTLMTHLKDKGLSENLNEFIGQERLFNHAGFARLGQPEEKVVEGWKSLWNQWNKSVLLADLMVARLDLAQNMTPENESRMLALKQAADDLSK